MLARRQATNLDGPFCWHLHKLSMRAYVEATWGWDEADQVRRFEASFRPAAVQIVELDDEPIGMLSVDTQAVPIDILSLEILPAFQRRGYGTAVIQEILRAAAGQPVRLQVLKVNPARSLYERIGFVVSGETETHWQMLHGISA